MSLWAGTDWKWQWNTVFWGLTPHRAFNNRQHFSTTLRTFRTNETVDAFSTLMLRLKNVWGNWNTSKPGEVEKGLQVAAITQYKYYPGSTENNWVKIRWLTEKPKSPVCGLFPNTTETGKNVICEKESEIPFVSPVACGWKELQAVFLVLVCSRFVCKSENCNSIS